jgi:hypothetical protein
MQNEIGIFIFYQVIKALLRIASVM